MIRLGDGLYGEKTGDRKSTLSTWEVIREGSLRDLL